MPLFLTILFLSVADRIFKNNYGVTPVSIASPRPAEEKVTDSSLRGYLLKVNNKNKWEKRWFVLENELLFYYKQATVHNCFFQHNAMLVSLTCGVFD